MRDTQGESCSIETLDIWFIIVLIHVFWQFFYVSDTVITFQTKEHNNLDFFEQQCRLLDCYFCENKGVYCRFHLKFVERRVSLLREALTMGVLFQYVTCQKSALMKSFLEFTVLSCKSFCKIIFYSSSITFQRLICQVVMVQKSNLSSDIYNKLRWIKKRGKKTPQLNNYLPEVAQEVHNQVWNWGLTHKLSCAAVMCSPSLLL